MLPATYLTTATGMSPADSTDTAAVEMLLAPVLIASALLLLTTNVAYQSLSDLGVTSRLVRVAPETVTSKPSLSTFPPPDI